jgi:hypothetical protein
LVKKSNLKESNEDIINKQILSIFNKYEFERKFKLSLRKKKPFKEVGIELFTPLNKKQV